MARLHGRRGRPSSHLSTSLVLPVHHASACPTALRRRLVRQPGRRQDAAAAAAHDQPTQVHRENGVERDQRYIIPKLLNHCQLELLNFVILVYLSVYIIMIRPGAVAHYEFFLLHVPTVCDYCCIMYCT